MFGMSPKSHKAYNGRILLKFTKILSSVQSLSCNVYSMTPWTAARQASLSITNSMSLLKTHVHWVSDAIQSSHPLVPFCLLVPFSSIRVFAKSEFLASGGQSIGVSASASVLPMNIQDWFPLGWTGWMSLQSKGLSRVFSRTTVWKHQFFGAQFSLWSNSNIHTWPLEKP